MDPSTIYHWRRLTDRITTSGQPSGEQLAEIAALGVTTVINLGLHSHEKALPDEAASVAALGMGYVHLPVEFGAPTESDFTAFCAALEELGDAFLHVHCIANYRVSAFFYRYRVAVQGEDPVTARSDLDAVWMPNTVWSEFIARGPRTT